MPRQKHQDWTKLARQMGRPLRDDVTKEQVIRSLFPSGPISLGLGAKTKQEGVGPGEPPLNFVGGTNSKTEWYVYWALEKLLGPEGDSWSYQQSYAGGRHIPGGAVVDFVVYTPMQLIMIRVQTWQFHLGAGPEKSSYDWDQKISLGAAYQDAVVIDVYEQYFINDTTGKAVLAVMADALAGQEWPNPLATGIAGDW